MISSVMLIESILIYVVLRVVNHLSWLVEVFFRYWWYYRFGRFDGIVVVVVFIVVV